MSLARVPRSTGHKMKLPKNIEAITDLRHAVDALEEGASPDAIDRHLSDIAKQYRRSLKSITSEIVTKRTVHSPIS